MLPKTKKADTSYTHPPMEWRLAAQALALLWTLAASLLRAAVEAPFWLARSLLASVGAADPDAGDIGKCEFYEGIVYHARRVPAVNKFAYPVRMALVSLDDPPAWWAGQAADHMDAAAARAFAGACVHAGTN